MKLVDTGDRLILQPSCQPQLFSSHPPKHVCVFVWKTQRDKGGRDTRANPCTDASSLLKHEAMRGRRTKEERHSEQ